MLILSKYEYWLAHMPQNATSFTGLNDGAHNSKSKTRATPVPFSREFGHLMPKAALIVLAILHVDYEII